MSSFGCGYSMLGITHSPAHWRFIWFCVRLVSLRRHRHCRHIAAVQWKWFYTTDQIGLDKRRWRWSKFLIFLLNNFAKRISYFFTNLCCSRHSISRHRKLNFNSQNVDRTHTRTRAYEINTRLVSTIQIQCFYSNWYYLLVNRLVYCLDFLLLSSAPWFVATSK